MATIRELTQLPVETAGDVNPIRELSQLPIEVAYYLIVKRYLSQLVIEVAGQLDTTVPSGYFETPTQQPIDPNITSPVLSAGSETAMLSTHMGRRHTSIEHPGR